MMGMAALRLNLLPAALQQQWQQQMNLLLRLRSCQERGLQRPLTPWQPSHGITSQTSHSISLAYLKKHEVSCTSPRAVRRTRASQAPRTNRFKAPPSTQRKEQQQ